jgi:hypothetical protein
MESSHPSLDYNSLLTFLGGLLGFMAVIVAIVDRVLRKTQDPAAKLLSFAKIVFPLLGLLVYFIFGFKQIVLLFYISGTVAGTIQYLRADNPPSRQDTAFLVATWSITILIIMFVELNRVLDLLSHLIGPLTKQLP